MTSQGGQPKQPAFLPDIAAVAERMGPDNQVLAWTPDSRKTFFFSRRGAFNIWFVRLLTVSVDGGPPEALPLDKGGLLAFPPDGSTITYNRISDWISRSQVRTGTAPDSLRRVMKKRPRLKPAGAGRGGDGRPRSGGFAGCRSAAGKQLRKPLR
jgi:hypothetical protein